MFQFALVSLFSLCMLETFATLSSGDVINSIMVLQEIIDVHFGLPKSRKQRTRIGSAFGDYLNILFDLPQGSIQVQFYLSFSCLICFIFTTIWTMKTMLMIPLHTFADRIMLKLLNFQNQASAIYLLGSKIMDSQQSHVKVIFWLVVENQCENTRFCY